MEKILEFQGEYRFLSNFWPAEITYEGLTYPSVENAYAASKTLDLAARIPFTTMTAGQAKRAGRSLVMRPSWNEVKLSVMRDLLRLKFSIPSLRALLSATGTVELIEGNQWNDTFWGVCSGRGQNHLGRLLMEVRAESKKRVCVKRAQINISPGIDTTVKSAQGIWRALAPTWDMVMGHKEGRISDAEYTALYEKILDAAPDSMYDALYQTGLSNDGSVTVLCYCKDGVFCHTHLIIDYVSVCFPDRFFSMNQVFNKKEEPVKKYYAGIGSRQSSPEILSVMTEIAQYMQSKGYTLRSGGARGADSAFESGAGSMKEIFVAEDAASDPQAMELVHKYHPNPAALIAKGPYVVNLMARNGYQILGRDLKTPVESVICWTPGGLGGGGTGQAIRIAKANEIKVFDLGNPETLKHILSKIRI